MQSTSRLVEKGKPLIWSIRGSLRKRNSMGSMPRRCARSSMVDSSANVPVTAPGPRMNHGKLISSGTTRYVELMLGTWYVSCGLRTMPSS